MDILGDILFVVFLDYLCDYVMPRHPYISAIRHPVNSSLSLLLRHIATSQRHAVSASCLLLVATSPSPSPSGGWAGIPLANYYSVWSTTPSSTVGGEGRGGGAAQLCPIAGLVQPSPSPLVSSLRYYSYFLGRGRVVGEPKLFPFRSLLRFVVPLYLGTPPKCGIQHVNVVASRRPPLPRAKRGR